ncbi:UDP-N-acetylmuramoylalanyl-D-glutamyl-2,6-diaminopimelate--D-alanyl-D-alanine ligase [Camelimonas abortus]|uniref:UDP-N-acetylmuramoyl-tripeptide--D-alanyl-D-alanine ligase n=1 Tax=Camelimonas abortus TaxID=1017184 RepID=A0ABV7LGU3_9HYPH
MTIGASSPLWTGEELLQAMGARPVGRLPEAIGGVSIDTRTLQPGDVFFAIAGLARDGHEFVPQALAAGAAAAVVDEAHAAALAPLVKERGALFVTPDVLRALEAAGRASRARMRGRVLAVTGSVGKTSTKEALRLALSGQGRVHASVASYNNHWGVPLTVARMPRETDYGVFEIGMSAPGEIRALVAMVRPHVAVVTAVEPVHLAYFPSVEAIADAKAEIFEGLEPGGVAVINADGPHAARLRQRAQAAGVAQIVTFGESEGADVRLKRLVEQPELSVIDADVMGAPAAWRLGAPGRHLAMNSLAVIAAVRAAGADVALAALALAGVQAPEGRGARTRLQAPGGSFLLVDESYNANPASMRAAIRTLGATPPGPRGRRIAVLGDMLELGPQAPELHAALAAELEDAGVDLVFVAGAMMRHLWDALPQGLRARYGESPAGLEPHVKAAIRDGDVVMVKGSNGSRISRVVAALKSSFPVAGSPGD